MSTNDDELLKMALRQACGFEEPQAPTPPSSINDIAEQAREVWELFLAKGGRVEDLIDRK